jgi:hypothetical protein
MSMSAIWSFAPRARIIHEAGIDTRGAEDFRRKESKLIKNQLWLESQAVNVDSGAFILPLGAARGTLSSASHVCVDIVKSVW